MAENREKFIFRHNFINLINMKNINKLFYIIYLVLTIIIYSCKDDDMSLSASYVKFSSSNIGASYAGSLNIYVEWSETEWEITKSKGDVIASLSATSGGNVTDKDQKTMIVIDLNENKSGATREQELTVKNLTTGETSKTIIKQGIRNASALFSEEQKTVNYLGGTINIYVNSSETEWELELDEGDLINNISPIQGGDATMSGVSTKIEISYNENTSEENVRSQKVYLTNKTDNSKTEFILYQEAKYAKVASATFDTSVKYQYVEGFGGMYPPQGWVSDPINEENIRKMFGNGEDQLGYNILRLMIYDKQSNWDYEIDNAKIAQSLGATIFACPWYCPIEYGETKTDENGNEYRILHKEHWEDYAKHIVKYINHIKGKGINLHAVSVQNEPDMHFTHWNEEGNGPADIASFVAQYGEHIRNTGVKLMSPEACGYQISYTDAVRNNTSAWNNTDIIAGHLYQGFIANDQYNDTWTESNASKLREYFSNNSTKWNKQWWMTEHLFNQGENGTSMSEWIFLNWDYNLTHLGKEINTCMELNCSAYVYWYLKRFYGMLGDTDKRSPVNSGEVTKNGYILSHYAKYAKNTTRIDLSFIVNQTEIEGTAYINENMKEITFVLLNYSDQPTTIELTNQNDEYEIKDYSAVITDENKNMENLSLAISSNNSGIIVPMSKKCIVSVKLKYN